MEVRLRNEQSIKSCLLRNTVQKYKIYSNNCRKETKKIFCSFLGIKKYEIIDWFTILEVKNMESEISEPFSQPRECRRKLATHSFELVYRVNCNLLGRAGLREGVVRLTSQRLWARGELVNHTSDSLRSRGWVVRFTSAYSTLRGGFAIFTTQQFLSARRSRKPYKWLSQVVRGSCKVCKCPLQGW